MQFFVHRRPWRTSKLQEKLSTLKKEHSAHKSMKFLHFFPIFVGHFCPPGSGSSRQKSVRNGRSMRILIHNTASKLEISDFVCPFKKKFFSLVPDRDSEADPEPQSRGVEPRTDRDSEADPEPQSRGVEPRNANGFRCLGFQNVLHLPIII